jgi:dipeptidyl aminopeptidase/acylaminoacyl peptidase
MTRAPRSDRLRSDRPRVARPPGSRDPYGLLPSGTPVAAILSVVGLLLVGVVTFAVANGSIPLGGLGSPGGSQAPGQTDDPAILKTPTPSGEVIVPTQEPGLEIPGSIVYAKAGNIWIQADGKARQLTDSGKDTQPSFSRDGTAVFFVRTRRVDGAWPVEGVTRNFRLDVPAIMRVPAAGGEVVRVFDGLVDPAGRLKWMGFIQAPVVSPNGATIAMASDLPDPTRSDVTLKLLNLKSGKVTDPGLDQVAPLGHQDPAWSPDGKRVAYVRADRDGAKGIPRIYVYTLATGKTRAMTGTGYLHPAFSPDGRYLAATRTSAFGTDVVILDASTGAELLKITTDGDSWGPAWSPAGDQVVFLHISGQVVDLRLAQLEGSAPAWTVGKTMDITSNAGLESVSRPHWFVPPDQLPAVTNPPATEAPAGSASTTP